MFAYANGKFKMKAQVLMDRLFKLLKDGIDLNALDVVVEYADADEGCNVIDGISNEDTRITSLQDCTVVEYSDLQVLNTSSKVLIISASSKC